MKNIYIASNTKGDPISVVIAKHRDDACIAFTAMKIGAFTIEEIDLESDIINLTPVIFLLTSIEANSRDFEHRIGGVDFRIWRRGL